ncbi:MAG: patatin-like phospholipase family protein [Planctomycetota bacterium]
MNSQTGSPPPFEIRPDADRPCDLVLKGGIASGIVYPEAVRRLASEFNFVGIAGTSAGAIVASITAAAEYRRREHGDTGGFEVLEEATAELMEQGRMLDLFRPDEPTRDSMEFVEKRFLAAEKQPGKLQLLAAVLLPQLPVPAVLLGLSGYAACRVGESHPFAALVGFTVVLGALLVGLSVRLYSLLERRADAWRDNGYGLCTGMANGNPVPPPEDSEERSAPLPPLSEWLHEQIQRAAGRTAQDPPLTFSELHEAKPSRCLEPFADRPGFRSIDFRAITTSVSLARPYELPLRTNRFAFKPSELQRIFPASVMEYLIRGWDPNGERKGRSSRRATDGQTLPMPPGDRWPIVVAARMSLSFPGLLTMVPLHDKDYDAPVPEGQERPDFRRIWFSDGGITSNFPVSRFDSVLPRWPTLGINLMYDSGNEGPRRSSGRSAKNDRVFLPQLSSNASPHILYSWEPQDLPVRGSSDGSLEPRQNVFASAFGWFMAMFRSAQVWHDNAYVQMRSSRERIAEVWLTQKEGGLNLNMEESTLRQLIRRGDVAAYELIRRYADPVDREPSGGPVEADTWDGYRWVRLKVTAAALSEQLESFARGFDKIQEGDRPWSDFFELSKEDVFMYPPEEQKRAAMSQDLADLAALAKQWGVTAKRHNAGRFRPGPNPPAHYRSTGSLDR